MRPWVTIPTMRLKLPPLLWLIAAPAPTFPQPLTSQMCLLFRLLDLPSILPNLSPFEVSITDTIIFDSCHSHSLSLGFLARPSSAPLGTSAGPTIQPVLNCDALDATSVCPLSTTQSPPTAVSLFVRKGAKNELVASKFSKQALPR